MGPEDELDRARDRHGRRRGDTDPRRSLEANEVRESSPSLWRSIARRLWGPIPWLLEIALVGEALLGKIVEPVIVGAGLLFSAIVGGVQERRGRSAVDLLREHLSVGARVRRDGRWQLGATLSLFTGTRALWPDYDAHQAKVTRDIPVWCYCARADPVRVRLARYRLRSRAPGGSAVGDLLSIQPLARPADS